MMCGIIRYHLHCDIKVSEGNVQVRHLPHFCAPEILDLLKASECIRGCFSITQSELLAVSLGSLQRNTGFLPECLYEAY